MKLLNRYVHFLLLAGFLLVAGCAPQQTREPDHGDPSLGKQHIDTIYVLPVVDARFDRSEELPIDLWTHRMLKHYIGKKNYKDVRILTDRSLIAAVTEEEFLNDDVDWLKEAVPPTARWVMALMVQDLGSQQGFGSTYNTEMSAMFSDVNGSVVLWRDKVVKQGGQGGLLGLALSGMAKQAAVETSVVELLDSFPNNPYK